MGSAGALPEHPRRRLAPVDPREVIIPLMRVVVDNSAGGDPDLADEVARALRAGRLDVEVRTPGPTTVFDTSVHLVSAGLTIRVFERPDRAALAVIEEAVRTALRHRPSLRRRTRSVPVCLGETARVIEWIDVVE